ncbi:MAG TPA: leucyl aminopeptidase [Gemmatimonadales bacterium]|jgi:leucyl aminopeptidase
MSIVVAHRPGDLASLQTSLLIVPVPAGALPSAVAAIDDRCGGALARCYATGDFTGKRDETTLVYANGGVDRILLIGMGTAADVTPAILRRAAMVAGKRARTLGVVDACLLWLPDATPAIGADRAGQSLAEGVPFGAWHYPDLKRPPESPRPVFVRCDLLTTMASQDFATGVERGNAIAAGQEFTRGLQVLPGNTCTPEFVAERARELATRHGFTITVLDRAAIQAAGMHALIAVAQGSALEPRFVAIEYRGSSAAPVVLVGKGVTFDTGGISIKPADRMEEMKYDMSGGAAVLGTFETLGRLKPAQHVIGLVPLAENMPSGTAYKPGDVVSSHLGKTIEVVNTDAEGRLILADALSWARQYKPAAVVDCATLTGAIVIALGHAASGMMGTDAPLLAAVQAAGEVADERVWELPLWDEYRELIKSDIADMKNSGGRPGGSITAGWFLREFAEGYPWVHVDIAATAYTDRESATQVRGPTGVMVRLFTELLLARP